MKKITELTNEQIDMMHRFARDWVAEQLNTVSTPETERGAEENYRVFSQRAYGKIPTRFIWYDSPVAVGSAVDRAVGSLYWSNVFAYRSFYAILLGLQEDLDFKAFVAMGNFVKKTHGSFLVDDALHIVRKPRLLTLDENGRFHNEVQKCIEYRDGWGFYSWHGTTVPEYVITTPKEKVTKEMWLKEQNQEVKRVLVEKVGYDKFMEWFKPSTIDTWNDYKLHHIFEQVDGEELRLLQMKDTSTERIYFLRVPLTVKTCRDAVAWSFQLDADKYLPEQEA